MSHETREPYRPNPLRPLQHRADCTDCYCEPEDDDFIRFRGPNAVLHTIEEASEQTGRTFTAQMQYVIEVCLGKRSISSNDDRDVNDWRALLAQMEICVDASGERIPFSITSTGIVHKPRPLVVKGS